MATQFSGKVINTQKMSLSVA